MIKITYIISTFRRCGPNNQLFNIVNHLNKDEFEAHIITLSPEPPDTLIDKFKKIDVKIHSLNLSRIKGMINGASKLKNILKEISADVIHSQGIRADLLASKIKGISHVLTSRNYPFTDNAMKFGKLKGWLLAKNHFNCIKKNKNSIACSKSIAEEYMQKNGLKLDYIQNAVDNDCFHSVSNVEKDKLRQKFKLPLDKKIFISVGNLISRKNTVSTIKAFNKLNKDDTLLLIAGDGVEKGMLLNTTENNDSIIFTGNIANVNQYLQLSDYYISASLAEGMPNTVLEAMSVGLPVVLSDIAPHREVFINDYEFFFSVNDISIFAGCLEKIIQMNYEELSSKMKNIIEKNFVAEIMSAKYQQLYKRLLS